MSKKKVIVVTFKNATERIFSSLFPSWILCVIKFNCFCWSMYTEVASNSFLKLLFNICLLFTYLDTLTKKIFWAIWKNTLIYFLAHYCRINLLNVSKKEILATFVLYQNIVMKTVVSQLTQAKTKPSFMK